MQMDLLDFSTTKKMAADARSTQLVHIGLIMTYKD